MTISEYDPELEIYHNMPDSQIRNPARKHGRKATYFILVTSCDIGTRFLE